MSAYTTNFHSLINFLYTRDEIESWFKDYELNDFLSSDEIDVINSRGVWNKDKLAKKIVDNYLMREIGFETIGLFKHYAKNEMNMIMEECLPLIYSASLDYNPLNDVDMYYDSEKDTTLNNTNTLESDSSGLSIYSDTPQGQISKTKILDGSYATSTNANESSGLSKSSGEQKGDENSKRHEYGRRTTNQKLISDYRKNIIAIDKMIIEKLNILFMGIYEEV